MQAGPMRGGAWGYCPRAQAQAPLFFFPIPLNSIFNSKAKTLVLTSSWLPDTLHALWHMLLWRGRKEGGLARLFDPGPMVALDAPVCKAHHLNSSDLCSIVLDWNQLQLVSTQSLSLHWWPSLVITVSNSGTSKPRQWNLLAYSVCVPIFSWLFLVTHLI